MIWIVLFAVGAGILAFWPIYDWIKARKTELQKDLGTTGQPVSDSWIKREIWNCPVCGKDHGGNRRERNRENCPFADGDYYHVWEEHLLDYTVTNFGGHFEPPYIVWEYDSKVYLTYKPDPSAVKKDQYGEIYVNAYYSTLFCKREEWDSGIKKELNRAVDRLRERILQSLHESGTQYIVGRDRILDMSVTKKPSCAETGYVIWKGDQEIHVTGIRSGATDDLFNHNRICRSNFVHRFYKTYTRRLCDTSDDLQKMSQDEIDAQAYGAYMDGAK